MTLAASATSVVHEAIAYYDQLLREAGMTAPQYDAFQKAVIDARVTFGGRSSCPYLRPCFVGAEQWDHVKRVSKLVSSAMDKAGKIIQADPELLNLLCLTEGEKTLIGPEPGYDWLTPTCRYDSFLTDDSYSYVELNAESPAGPAFTTVLANLWLEQDVMKKFQQKFAVETFDVRQPLLEMLIKVYATWRSNGHTDRREKPQIAIIDYLDVPTLEEFHLCQEYFQAAGYDTVVADPRELTYENGRLTDKNGFEIDLIYRRLLTNEFLERFDELGAFWNSYKDGVTCVVNPFRSKLLHKKMIFGILTDERVLPRFTPEEQEAVRTTVPWTRLVKAGTTTDAHGKHIDLLPWIMENQQNLVLKPNDDYGGKGIYIGWVASAEEWAAGVKEAQSAPYVVQWKVAAPQVPFPVFDPATNAVVWEPNTIDLDPYMFFGQAHGFLTRLSTTALCNVTAGGGIVPTFVVSRA